MDIVPISTGNPHGVIFVDNVDKVELERIGPMVEHHKSFPKTRQWRTGHR